MARASPAILTTYGVLICAAMLANVLPMKPLTDRLLRAAKFVVGAPWYDSPDPRTGAVLTGTISAIVGLVLGAIIVFWLPPVPEHSLSALDYALSLRAPVLLIAILMATTIFAPRLNIYAYAVLPGALIVWLALRLYLSWRVAATTPEMLAGRLPWQDGSHYYVVALSFINGQASALGMRKPFNVVLLALRLYFAHGNLQGALAIGVAAVSVSMLLAAREVARTLGIAAATAFVVATAGYIAWLLMTPMTEPHGLFLGSLAFACLWRGAMTRSLALYCVALLFLTAGFAARLGPVSILPCLILWGALTLDEKRRWSWAAVGAGIAACACGLFPMLYIAIYGVAMESFNAGLAYTIYGFAVGGDWTSVMHDHPELFNSGTLTEAQLPDIIYRLALQALISNPLPALSFYLKGLLHAYPLVIALIPTLPLQALAHIGVLACLASFRDRMSLLLLLSLLGIILLAPFSMIDGGARVFAVTMPLLAAFCAIGVVVIVGLATFIVQPQAHDVPPHESSDASGLGMAASYVCALAILAIAPLILIRQSHAAPSPENASCPGSEIAISYYPNKNGMGLRVRDVPVSDRSVVSFRDFDRDPEFTTTPKLEAFFKTLRPPFDLLLAARNTAIGPQLWFAVAEGMALPIEKPLLLCGDAVSTDELDWTNRWRDHFMTVRSVRPLSQ
jgi:hypothetical protein